MQEVTFEVETITPLFLAGAANTSSNYYSPARLRKQQWHAFAMGHQEVFSLFSKES